MLQAQLIHSADPILRTVVTTVFTHVVRLFPLSKSHKTKQLSSKNRRRETVGPGRGDH